MVEKTTRRRLSFKEKYELIKEMEGVAKEFTLNKYRITDLMYNRAIDSGSEVSVKMKSNEFEQKLQQLILNK